MPARHRCAAFLDDHELFLTTDLHGFARIFLKTMRQPDINRLARIVEHYEAIDRIFDSLQTSLEKQESEFISINHISVPVYHLVRNMRKDAKENREWIERKLKQIKEL
jgi:hypothetical protein